MKTNKTLQFGEHVTGYEIPVLNEREVRASAGILFLLLYTSLMLIFFRENFILIKYSITFFLTDFLIRVLINPRFAPSLILGRLFVKKQTPEYVGAAQKKFAWIIGIVLASIMFGLMVVLNTFSIITGLICLICLVFLFFEAVFGICLGCLFYGWFYKDKAQYCPGEVCDTKTRQEIQKITLSQLLVVAIFIAYAVVVGHCFNAEFSKIPTDLFEMLK